MKKIAPFVSVIMCFISWCCILLVYGFFCYMWNASLEGQLKILDPIVKYGYLAPIPGFLASVYCLICGGPACRVLVAIPCVLHGRRRRFRRA